MFNYFFQTLIITLLYENQINNIDLILKTYPSIFNKINKYSKTDFFITFFKNYKKLSFFTENSITIDTIIEKNDDTGEILREIVYLSNWSQYDTEFIKYIFNKFNIKNKEDLKNYCIVYKYIEESEDEESDEESEEESEEESDEESDEEFPSGFRMMSEKKYRKQKLIREKIERNNIEMKKRIKLFESQYKKFIKNFPGILPEEVSEEVPNKVSEEDSNYDDYE